jgi:hypothetical protein
MRTIDWDQEIAYQDRFAGKFAFICFDSELIALATNRIHAVLKIFMKPLIGELENYRWGYDFKILVDTKPRDESGNLIDCSRIQNLLAFHGVAPRVYDVGVINYKGKKYPYQVAEEIMPGATNGIQKEEVRKTIEWYKMYYGFEMEFDDTYRDDNWINGKLIDFQGFRLRKDYEELMYQRFMSNAKWAGNFYQDYKQLHGWRNSDRIAMLEKAELNLKNKRVLDIGCSGGQFSRWASDRGAYEVHGVDLPEVIEVTREVSNYDRYFNIDWTGIDLNEKDLNARNVDVIFFLSMTRHVGLKSWLFEAPTVVYEHNGDVDQQIVVKEFKRRGYKAKDLGISGRDDDRHLYIFTKI